MISTFLKCKQKPGQKYKIHII